MKNLNQAGWSNTCSKLINSIIYNCQLMSIVCLCWNSCCSPNLRPHPSPSFSNRSLEIQEREGMNPMTSKSKSTAWKNYQKFRGTSLPRPSGHHWRRAQNPWTQNDTSSIRDLGWATSENSSNIPGTASPNSPCAHHREAPVVGLHGDIKKLKVASGISNKQNHPHS